MPLHARFPTFYYISPLPVVAYVSTHSYRYRSAASRSAVHHHLPRVVDLERCRCHRYTHRSTPHYRVATLTLPHAHTFPLPPGDCYGLPYVLAIPLRCSLLLTTCGHNLAHIPVCWIHAAVTDSSTAFPFPATAVVIPPGTHAAAAGLGGTTCLHNVPLPLPHCVLDGHHHGLRYTTLHHLPRNRFFFTQLVTTAWLLLRRVLHGCSDLYTPGFNPRHRSYCGF